VSVTETNWSSFISTTGGDDRGSGGDYRRARASDQPNAGRRHRGDVRYSGARDLYTVLGSPVRAVSAHLDQVEHRATHERILETLTTPGRVESGNEKPVDLLDG
jgi:hypothetical protein